MIKNKGNIQKLSWESLSNKKDSQTLKLYQRIPSEILLKIFSLLAPIDLINCQLVSKNWKVLSSLKRLRIVGKWEEMKEIHLSLI